MPAFVYNFSFEEKKNKILFHTNSSSSCVYEKKEKIELSTYTFIRSLFLSNVVV